MTVQRSQTREFKILIQDQDSETIYIRLFLDGNYRQWIHDDQVSGNDLEKIADFEIKGLCGEKVNNEPGSYLLEIYVSDKEFRSIPGDLRVPQEGGFRDNGFWDLECIEDLLTPDGGL